MPDAVGFHKFETAGFFYARCVVARLPDKIFFRLNAHRETDSLGQIDAHVAEISGFTQRFDDRLPDGVFADLFRRHHILGIPPFQIGCIGQDKISQGC